MPTKEKRKNYSISPNSARDLARGAANLADDLGRHVEKQAVLEALIELIDEDATYKKVRKALKVK